MCQISAKPVTTAKNALMKPERAVLRHLDRPVFARIDRELGISHTHVAWRSKRHRLADMRQDRKIPCRRRRCRGPFESPSIPRIVADAQRFAGADRDNELNDLAHDACMMMRHRSPPK